MNKIHQEWSKHAATYEYQYAPSPIILLPVINRQMYGKPNCNYKQNGQKSMIYKKLKHISYKISANVQKISAKIQKKSEMCKFFLIICYLLRDYAFGKASGSWKCLLHHL